MGVTAAVALRGCRGGYRKSGAEVAPRNWGRTGRRFLSLFDIVGIDEGTCGRRLAGSGGLRALDTRLKPSLTCMSSYYLSTVSEVQVGLPEMSCSGLAIPLGWGGDINLRV